MEEKTQDAVTARIEAFAAPMLERMGMELVEVQFRRESQGWVVRLFIDREGGVTVDDCAAASRALDDWLEAEDFIDCAYNLEVSSPGLERPLKTDRDFLRAVGKRVRVKLRPAGGEPGGALYGTLEGLEGDSVVVEIDGARRVLQRERIVKARLSLD